MEELEVHETLFTPGKLADETQLGSITSLINFDNQHNMNISRKLPAAVAESTTEKDNDILEDSSNKLQTYQSPPASLSNLNQPLKPFKKRVIIQNKDSKNIVRRIFSTDDSSDNDQNLNEMHNNVNTDDDNMLESHDTIQNYENKRKDINLNNNIDSNVTQQELIDKVVDHICSVSEHEKNENKCITCSNRQNKISKEQRTSVRSCKGLRYAKFMAEGKLLVNKRSKKQNLQYGKHKNVSNLDENNQVPKHVTIELNETIKKLTERTSKLSSTHDLSSSSCPDYILKPDIDTSNDNIRKMFRASDFNLDAKIEALPSLSLEKFQQKKKENKKKKFIRNSKIIDTTEHKKLLIDKAKIISENKKTITGSRKRKPRKQSITRLDPQSEKFNIVPQESEADLFGLATLAEVAAKKAKLDEQ